MRATLVLALLLLASPIDAAHVCPARDSSNRDLPVTIQIHDYEHLPIQWLVRAREIVAQMYGKIGVQIEWLGVQRRNAKRNDDANQPSNPGPAAQMTVMIVTPEMAARGRVPEGVLGYAAVPYDGGHGRIAYVLYDRIHQVAMQGPANLVELLGFVIAHETGHLLLGRGSGTKTGLMKCHWELREMRHFVANGLGFSDLQAGRIRSTLLNQPASGELLAAREATGAAAAGCVTRTE